MSHLYSPKVEANPCFSDQMSTVATILPMSLLACLGTDAEAIRDILIHRLQAQTEDILLKIAIVKFFT